MQKQKNVENYVITYLIISTYFSFSVSSVFKLKTVRWMGLVTRMEENFGPKISSGEAA
jgi:hypothetical protein